MANIIYFGVDLHGHVNPTLALIRKLVERGDKVVYYCSDEFRSKIERTGATFRSYRGLLNFTMHEGSGIDTFLVFADFILEKGRLLADRLYEEVSGLRPDCVMHDAFAYWGKELAAKLDVPGVSVFANFPFIHEMAESDPGFFMEVVLRAADDPLYKKYKGQADMYPKLIEKVSRMIARRHGLGEVNVINDVFGSKQPLNLIFSSRAFQLYEEAFDESYLFAGYTADRRSDAEPFPMERLDGRPLVYIAFGTILHELGDLIEGCMKALGGEDVQVVMSVGRQFPIERLAGVPDNFLIMPYVPQLELLERASAFITHGGANSIYESLCAGVPMVVVPQAFDEFMGALMVERAEAGIRLESESFAPEALREAVRTVLGDPAYRLGCARIRDSFRETGGLDMAVRRIIHYMEQRVNA
ncbi:macrolide family glycosyltransferase [Paenibacillus xanthanilyticus]|uniref:Macrolide family glycosyltransferase n=1 Tax=Paenibacillus xanthanilyticus TaxID=1783531 RepID=A0ABV8K5G5_9BACL